MTNWLCPLFCFEGGSAGRFASRGEDGLCPRGASKIKKARIQ